MFTFRYYPDGEGPAPIERAILAGDKKSGVVCNGKLAKSLM